MPRDTVKAVIDRLIALEVRVNELYRKTETHLEEGGYVKSDLMWLKWINMGIAALVCFKLVADYLIKH